MELFQSSLQLSYQRTPQDAEVLELTDETGVHKTVKNHVRRMTSLALRPDEDVAWLQANHNIYNCSSTESALYMHISWLCTKCLRYSEHNEPARGIFFPCFIVEKTGRCRLPVLIPSSAKVSQRTEVQANDYTDTLNEGRWGTLILSPAQL